MTEREEQQFRAYIQLGSELFSMQRYRAAYEAFTNAVNINPENEHARSCRIGTMEALGWYDEAVAEYKKLIKIYEKELEKANADNNIRECISNLNLIAKELNELGACYRNMGDDSNATTCFRRADVLSQRANQLAEEELKNGDTTAWIVNSLFK